MSIPVAAKYANTIFREPGESLRVDLSDVEKDSFHSIERIENAAAVLYERISREDKDQGDAIADSWFKNHRYKNYDSAEYTNLIQNFEHAHLGASQAALWAKVKILEKYLTDGCLQGHHLEQDINFLMVSNLDLALAIKGNGVPVKGRNSETLTEFMAGTMSMCGAVYYDAFRAPSRYVGGKYAVEIAMAGLGNAYKESGRKVDELQPALNGIRAEVASWIYLDEIIGQINILTSLPPEMAAKKFPPEEQDAVIDILTSAQTLLGNKEQVNFIVRHANVIDDAHGHGDLVLVAKHGTKVEQLLMIDVKSFNPDYAFGKEADKNTHLWFGGVYPQKSQNGIEIKKFNEKLIPPMSEGTVVFTKEFNSCVLGMRIPNRWLSNSYDKGNKQSGDRTEKVPFQNLDDTLEAMETVEREDTRIELLESIAFLLSKEIDVKKPAANGSKKK